MKRLCRVLFGYLIWDDRGGTPIDGLPPRDPFWLRAWWGDEDFPAWWNWLAYAARRLCYRRQVVQCVCPGCTETVLKAYSSWLCGSCINEDCQHDDEAEAGKAGR